MPAERHWQIDNDDVAALRTLDEVEYADGMLFGGSYDCTRGERRGSYALMGLGRHAAHPPQPLLYGRYINDMDMTGKRKGLRDRHPGVARALSRGRRPLGRHDQGGQLPTSAWWACCRKRAKSTSAAAPRRRSRSP